MRVGEVVTLLPEAENLLAEYGLHCAGCAMGGMETLEEGCRIHGFSKEDTEDLLTDLHILLRSSHRPQKLMITDGAARALAGILTENKKQGNCFSVGFDDSGKFFLEFLPRVPRGAKVFHNLCVPSVRVVVPPLLFCRVGGATVDYREGRFKLDFSLPSSSA